MKPTCLVSVAALSRRMLDLSPSGGTLRRLARGGVRTIEPVLPAVTCTMQATLTTGAWPGEHGIIANGLYLAELGRVSFWEQSNKLLDVERVWKRPATTATNGRRDTGTAATGGGFTGTATGGRGFTGTATGGRGFTGTATGGRGVTAMLFWQNSMFGAADVVITPRPIHTPDGRTISSCYSTPAELYGQLADKLGPFELKSYWGPLASIASSQWIGNSAVEVWRGYRPSLELVYLPHLDYPLQKLGPDDPRLAAEVAAVDALIGRIAEAVEADGGRVVVAGDYGIVPARRAVLPNVALRQAGLLKVRNVGGVDTIEIGELEAFAMVDHQAAHVYCADAAARGKARDVLSDLDGVAEVIDLAERDPFHLRHRRSGQLVVLAEPDAWFAYYWWLDDAAAPPMARTVDIHRKPGYDPCELFFDPAARSIPINPSLVKGTHGLPPASDADRPVLLASEQLGVEQEVVSAVDFAGAVLKE